MTTNFSCWAVLLLTSSTLLCATTRTKGEALEVINGSTNLVGGVATDQGVAYVQPGNKVSWPSFTSVTNLEDGTNAGSWPIQPTHAYTVLLDARGQIVVQDSAPHNAATFMWGFGVFFVIFLFAWGAGWSKRVVDPGNWSE